jgi:hypothetical protein
MQIVLLVLVKLVKVNWIAISIYALLDCLLVFLSLFLLKLSYDDANFFIFLFMNLLNFAQLLICLFD